MPDVMTNAASHRAQIVAEAVVSAYIHEIARPRPRREHADVRCDRVLTSRAIVPNSHGARPRSRALARRRGRALELELAA